MRCLVILLMALLLASPVLAEEPADPVLKNRVYEAIGLAGDLWALGGDGALVSFRGVDRTRNVEFERGVADIAAHGGQLYALIANASGLTLVPVDQPSVPFPEIAIGKDERVAGLAFDDDAPVVLTEKALWRWNGAAWDRTRLRGPLRVRYQPSVVAVPGALYVGNSVGEWGGGLQRVDLATGRVREIERIDDPKEICGEPLDKDCDPVTGLVADPARPGCVLAAVGLRHMLAHGRLLRACGAEVELVYERKVDVEPGESDFDQTWPFYGLVATADGAVWTVGPGKLFRLKDGQVSERDFSGFHAYGTLQANTDTPGLLILSTDANWAVSVSGFTPLIAPVYP